ncbi:MAG: histidine kinase [Clostridiales bacterium]|nr:histidine kinase [Clostridiales bacterium]
MKLLNLFHNIKIRYKFIFVYSLIALPLLIIGISTYIQANSMVKEQAEININNIASSLSNNIKYKIENYEYMMDQIIYNKKFVYILSNDYSNLTNLSEDLREYLSPYFVTIGFVNRNIFDIVVYHEQYIPEFDPFIFNSKKVMDNDWYKNALNTTSNIWDFTNAKVYSTKMFPPFLMNGKTAILSFEFEKKIILEEILSEIPEEYGIILYTYDGSYIYEQNLIDSDYDLIGSIISGSDTEKLLYIKNNMEKIGINFLLYANNETTVTTISIIAVTASLIIISIVFMIVAIKFFDISLIKPLVRLDGYIYEVKKGNYSKTMGLAHNDEIGRISQQFDRMVKEIDKLVNEVHDANIKKKEAEITALRTQINPHFLYNSLSAITWKAVFNNDSEIYDIATSLATFYRTVLNYGDKLIIVKNEIENIRAYIKIQCILRDNMFETKWNIQKEVYDYKMLNFILQPIVENAIIHGIDEKKNGDKGELLISGFIENNHIIFNIEDNGEGIKEELMKEILNKNKGYGIKNINERIKLYYGNDYDLVYSRSKMGGVKVQVKIPILDTNNS